jgi:hypothetical protein
VLAEKGYLFAHTCGNRSYEPAVDNPLMVPAFSVPAYPGEQFTGSIIEDVFPMATNGKIVVLLLHGVPDPRQEVTNCPLSLFKDYLKFLKDNNFKVINMRDLA